MCKRTSGINKNLVRYMNINNFELERVSNHIVFKSSITGQMIVESKTCKSPVQVKRLNSRIRRIHGFVVDCKLTHKKYL